MTVRKNVGPLSVRADIGSVDTANRTVEVIFSTGARVLRTDWFDGVQFWEELDMAPESVRLDRLNSGAPFLESHSQSVASVLGVVESARIDGGKGIASVRFAAEGVDPNADMIFRKIVDRVIRAVSVGYRIHRAEKFTVEGEKIPTLRAVDWTPHEISVVAIGADPGAGFRADDPTNVCEIVCSETPSGSLSQEKNTVTEEEKRAAEQVEIAKRAAEIEAEVARRTLLARERDAGITSICRSVKLGDEFARKLIASPATLDQARAQVIDELARLDAVTPTDTNVRVTAVEGQDERDKLMRGVTGALIAKMGSNGAVQRAKRSGVAEFKDLDVDGGHFRGMTIADIARMCVERSGQSTKMIYDRERILGMALNQRAGGATGDFAVLMENAMYKVMRAEYGLQASTWRRWCGTDTVQDFKNSNRYMTGAFAENLPVVPEGAEYKQIQVPDGSKLAIATETRGGIIALSRQALINDDMGALTAMVAAFGRLAGDAIEAAAYEMLALNGGLGPTVGGVVFFDAANANITTGAALSVAALDLDRQKMRSQTRGNGYIEQTPGVLLLPISLESAAKILNESAFDHTSALDQKPNAVRGMFADIVASPRLTGTRRYLVSTAKEAFKVVFLEGSGEGPTMASEEGFSIDGTRWKVRIDFKMNSFDPKTAITNAGA